MDFILLLFIVTGGWSLGEENAPEIQIYGSVTRILGVNGSIWSVQPGRAVNLTCKHYTEYVEWVYPQVMDALSPKEFPLHSQSVGLEGELLHYKNIRPQNSGLHLCHLRNNVNIYSEVYINVTDDISWRRGYMAMPGVGSYKLYNAAKSWSKAQRHCLAQGSHLAVPDSQLLKAFGRMSKIPLTIWVGLQRTGEWKTADGSLINATNIAQWNLTNEDGSGSCVSWLSGQFVRSPCNNTKHFICQQVAAGNGTCLSDYIDLVGVGCTQIANTCMTWKEAQQYCEASGGRMVVPSSALEKNLFQDNEDELDLWVGIHRIKEEWTTMSGQPYTTLDILKSKPEEAGDREECIVFNSTDHRLQPCSDEYQYICQQDQDWIATKVVTPRTTVEGSAITKILGTNGTEWGVAPGRRVALTCEPEYGSVQWEYPQGILKPIVQPHLWDDAEGKRLIYESITTNNTGVHRCYLKENPLISSTIYLHVSRFHHSLFLWNMVLWCEQL